MQATLSDDFKLSGVEVDLDSAERLRIAGLRLIEQAGQSLEVNLTGLKRANSVTVALLLSWYRHAVLNEKSILFTGLSQELRNIIEFSGLTQVLLPPKK